MPRVVKTVSTIIAFASLFLPIRAVAQPASSQAANQSMGSLGIDIQIRKLPEQASKIVVDTVIEDGPAGKAGLKAGDIIASVDSQAVGNVAEFSNAIRAHAIGSTVTIGYVRNGHQFETSVTVMERNQLWSRWLTKGSEQGDLQAQALLARALLVGDFGLAQNETQAAYWARKAAAQGNAYAQVILGLMYADGKGVPQNYAEAVRWYRKADEQGNAAGQYNLGVMYANGRGVPKDYAEAVRCFRNAADQGLATGQNNLGVMYKNGWGVVQDYAEAVRWYRNAADQGLAIGQDNLGWMYANGRGVPEDRSVALYWYNKAAEQGNEDAQKAAQRLKADGVMPRPPGTNDAESSGAKPPPQPQSQPQAQPEPQPQAPPQPQPQAPPQPQIDRRLAIDEIEKLLKGSVSPARVTTLVQQYGVSFELSDDIEKQLRGLGADDKLLIAIAKNHR
jgi:TPR repeat protein